MGLKRGGLLLSLIVLPLYVPVLIFGAEVARRGAEGLAVETPLLLLGGLTLAGIALLPFAAAAAIRIKPALSGSGLCVLSRRMGGHRLRAMSLWEYANPKKFMATSGVILPWCAVAAAVADAGGGGLGVLRHAG